MDTEGRKRGPEEERSERPVRRSRLVSEDAKFAMKLQQEEDKKAYRAAAVPQKPAPKPAPAPPKPTAAAPKAGKVVKKSEPASQPTYSPPAAKRGGKGGPVGRGGDNQGQGAAPAGRGRGKAAVRLPTKVVKTGGGGRTWKCRGGDDDLVAAALLVAAESKGGGGGGGGKGDPEGKVSFSLSPFENSLPAMRRGNSEQVWEEDQTVLQIKRHVVEDIWQGGREDHSMLCLRTPSGLLLGNDHSLRYVRSVLWPPSQGKLNILYSKQLPGVGLL